LDSADGRDALPVPLASPRARSFANNRNTNNPIAPSTPKTNHARDVFLIVATVLERRTRRATITVGTAARKPTTLASRRAR
jgi:hypothetical protein